MKKVLVSGYIGFNNFGDEAIFLALSTHLKQLGYEISVLCNNKKEVKKKYNVKTYNYKKPAQILKAIMNCDILISGGGSLLQNKTSNLSLFYYLFIILIAKLFFKKTIIFAQGIEPIKGKVQTLITKNILKTTDFISVRDKNSFNLLKNWGLSPMLVSDPVYSIVQNIEICNEKKDIIVQLRDFKGMDDIFLENLANAIKKANQNNEKINVFSFQDEIDEKICKKFIEILKKYNIKAEYISNKSINETIEIVNRAKYMISTRLHGVLISHALKTKTFALIYDKKIETIANELNIENIDINNYEPKELETKLTNFFTKEKEIINYRKFNWKCIDNVLEFRSMK